MGSSKKHKKETKKKKHRSRSCSPSELGVEKERKRHKKHKDRKRDRSPEVEEVPVNSHLAPQNGDSHSTQDEYARDRQMREEHIKEKQREDRSREKDEHNRDRDRDREDHSRERDREEHSREREREERKRERDREEHRERDREEHQNGKDKEEHKREREKEERHKEIERKGQSKDREREREEKKSMSPQAGTSTNAESLSVEETNRLRAKLGLKPLEVAEKVSDDGKIKDDLGEFYHKPATNITQQKKSEKIREKLQERKEKRKLEQRIQTTLLAEQSDDEDASAWVLKSRDIEKQKKEAAKRAAALDEMDAVFGVGALVAEQTREDRAHSYTAGQLRGLRVGHNVDALAEGHDVVLTLADKNVLDEDNQDVLVNVNIVDNEKYKKNIEERKKAKSGYQAYDDAEDLEAAALGYSKPVLAKYDEEIDQGKAARGQGFVIGDEAALEAKRFRQMMMRERQAGGVEKRLESLLLPELKVASDYLNEQELSAKFKKPKKKGKIRKKAKHEPIDVDDYDPNTAPLETDDTDVKPEDLKMEMVEEDEVEPDSELQVALARARRLRQAEQIMQKMPKVEDLLERVKDEPSPSTSDPSPAMVLDATAEFCRTLGDIPTYGHAGNRDSQVEIMDFDLDEPEDEAEAEAASAWSRVDVNADKPADITAKSCVALDVEPRLGAGVAGALQLALSKGYLERTNTAPAPRPVNEHLLAAAHYSIEDKTYGEDDKHGRRERGYAGPLQEFREKSHFRPHIKLEYADDEGRPLCPKEAFRYLSHKFHGKGPGKNKQEKRIKKAVQEGLMKKMSSTDTPLNTLQMLQDKQKETHSPYIVLSGAKRDQPH